jgi:hypothetical protein
MPGFDIAGQTTTTVLSKCCGLKYVSEISEEVWIEKRLTGGREEKERVHGL